MVYRIFPRTICIDKASTNLFSMFSALEKKRSAENFFEFCYMTTCHK